MIIFNFLKKKLDDTICRARTGYISQRYESFIFNYFIGKLFFFPNRQGPYETFHTHYNDLLVESYKICDTAFFEKFHNSLPYILYGPDMYIYLCIFVVYIFLWFFYIIWYRTFNWLYFGSDERPLLGLWSWFYNTFRIFPLWRDQPNFHGLRFGGARLPQKHAASVGPRVHPHLPRSKIAPQHQSLGWISFT